MNETIYIFKSGKVSRKANTIYLETTEGEKKYIPVEATKEIHFFGEVSLNKEALELFSQKEILLHFYNYYDYYVGTFYPREHYNSGYMIVKQTQHYIDKDLRLSLAKKFVTGGIENVLKVLAYYNRRGADLKKQISFISLLKDSASAVNDIGQLMATEGKARKLYYSCFSQIVNNPEFSMTTRSRRPPQNFINALISFGNSLIYTEILSQIYRTHLDPRIGYLHESNFRRFSLNLDVSEIFKPILVDRAIFSLINKNVIDGTCFEKRLNGIYLSEKGAKLFVEAFDEKLNTTVQRKDLGRNVSYRTLIRLELYKLEKHFMGEAEYDPYISNW